MIRFVPTVVLLSAVLAACGSPRDRTASDAATDRGADSGGQPATAGLDCSDRANFADPRCLRPHEVPPGSIGSGPAFFGDPRGGFVEDGQITFPISPIDDPGFVMSVDLATGDRTIRSGTYDDPARGQQTVGDGPELRLAVDIKLGPDGWYVLTAEGIVHIDPANGNRTIARTFDSCRPDDSGFVVILKGFAMDTDGLAYVAGMSVSGAGILALAESGACDVVSWTAATGYEGRGSGPEAPFAFFSGLTLHLGFLYATYRNTEMLYRFDLTTGDRLGVSSSADARPIGEGDELNTDGFLFFPSDDRVYSTGTNQPHHIAEVDLSNGARRVVPSNYGSLRLAHAEASPIFPHPTEGVVVLGVEQALHVLEVETGNSFILSR